MKTRTNQPVYKDNGEELKDSDLSGGTKLYSHNFITSNSDEIKFLSLRKEPYIKEEYDDISSILSDILLFGGYYYNDSDGFDNRILGVIYDEEEDSLRISCLDDTRVAISNSYLIDFTDFTDIVTPL